MDRPLTAGELASARYLAAVNGAEPEAPGIAWECPECQATVPARRFYCDHTASSVLSNDMRPRLVRKVST